jgi:hypothetical protein
MPASNSKRAMTRMPAFALGAVLAAMLASLLGACHADTECVGGQFRCDGDVALNCANFAGRNHEHDVWFSSQCGPGKCKLDTALNAAFCARDATPDPRCDENRWGFCDGTVLTSCREGYVVATKDCATSEAAAKVCVPLGHADVGRAKPLNAMCASAPEPSALCRASNRSDTCDGNEIVVCEYGHEVARLPCGPGLTCQSFGVCST